MLANAFANIVTGFSAQFGAPFVAGTATWQTAPEFDAGGSYAAPRAVQTYSCQVQTDAPTQAMRASEGFLETDARLLVLAFNRALDTLATITVGGTVWKLMSCQGDPAGIGYECRGRKV